MHRQSVLLVALSLAVEAAGPSWGDWGEWGAACTACTGAASRGRTRVCIPAMTLTALLSGANGQLELSAPMIVDSVENSTELASVRMLPDVRLPPACPYSFLQGNLHEVLLCLNYSGDSSDQNTPPCDTGDVCTFPKPSCCSGTKAVDMDAKRFYCKTA
ncbi:hypothetical protein ANCDUO_08198 [Ancylostoma duodenale]|uniref:Uncharacterized protein n=1 Tax=Ancylostoma duodenale TaxID=51022 RepID=A0A0C2GQZ4_9BILA|nr:hypothetical protein ANCDUO_08198 [Ancylostoma duodenale]